MDLGRIFAISALAIALAAGLFWERYDVSFLAPELTINQKPLRPPPEPAPAPAPNDYAEARAKPCYRPEPVINTSICDVIKSPEMFAGKCIRVAGRFLTDGLEGSVIIDESCPKVGLEPWASEKLTTSRIEAIWRPGGLSTFDQNVSGRFTGRFVWRPRAYRDARVLEISKLNSLSVQNHPEK